jgi:hypothetical protein
MSRVMRAVMKKPRRQESQRDCDGLRESILQGIRP